MKVAGELAGFDFRPTVRAYSSAICLRKAVSGILTWVGNWRRLMGTRKSSGVSPFLPTDGALPRPVMITQCAFGMPTTANALWCARDIRGPSTAPNSHRTANDWSRPVGTEPYAFGIRSPANRSIFSRMSARRNGTIISPTPSFPPAGTESPPQDTTAISACIASSGHLSGGATFTDPKYWRRSCWPSCGCGT